MSSTDFIQQQNIDMIWDILVDAEKDFIFKNNGHYTKAIRGQCTSIIKNFYEQEKNARLSLIEMNKKIISILVNEWIPMLKTQEQTIQNQQQNQGFGPSPSPTPSLKSQVIQLETTEAFVTAEEIQQNRKTQFEKELTLKRNEFQGAMSLPPPPMVDFKEKMDEPIGEMEKLIAETIAQRNFEISQLQTMNPIPNANPNPNTNTKVPWLQDNTTEQSIKYIKIGEPIEENIIIGQQPSLQQQLHTSLQQQLHTSLQQHTINEPIIKQKKHLTWSDESPPDSKMDAIFKKLKPMKPHSEPSELVSVNEKLDLLISKMNDLVELLSKK